MELHLKQSPVLEHKNGLRGNRINLTRILMGSGKVETAGSDALKTRSIA
jgi:hypothetical protein